MSDHDNLETLEKELGSFLSEHDMLRFVDPSTVSDWLIQKDKEYSRFMTASNLLTGLMPPESFQTIDAPKRLMDILFRLQNAVNPIKVQDVGTEGFIESDRDLPPREWREIMQEGFRLTNEGDYHSSARFYDDMFESLIQEETTDREPFRFFFNASTAYFLGGYPGIGKACLDYSLKLNPNYPLARKRVEELSSGKMDGSIREGKAKKEILVPYEEQWSFERDMLPEIPSRALITGLRSIGIEVTPEMIKDWAARYNSAESAVEGEMDMEDVEDPSLHDLSVYGLWRIYAPDEPSHEELEDQLLDFMDILAMEDFEFIEPTMLEIERLIMTDKQNFLADWSGSFSYRYYAKMLISMMAYAYMNDMKEMGEKIAKRLKKETGDDLWDIPMSFFQGKALEKIESKVNKKKVDHEKTLCLKLFKDAVMDERGSFPIKDDVDLPSEISEDDVIARVVDTIEGCTMEELYSTDDPVFHPSSVYFRYLKGMGLRFETERDVESVERTFTVGQRRRTKKGRNDPCPCGSGMKYKKCCLIKEGK